MKKHQRIALITGASSGIGRATAIKFAELGYSLILCGRRNERLEALKEMLGAKVPVHTLTFDVRNREEVEHQLSSITESWRNIDILVNNAGNAHGLSPLHTGDSDDWDAMMDGNVKGLLYVSRVILPGMVERRSGHIVNLSSIAGKQTYANGTVYCASKKAVEAVSEGMRLELTEYGIKVTNIAPGAVATEFSQVRFKGDSERANKVYEGYEALKPEDIADAIAYAVTAPERVTIADMVIYPKAQSSPGMIFKK